MSQTAQEIIEALAPMQRAVEQIAGIRPIMLKTEEGWETWAPTDLLVQAALARDAIWQRMFEALGDQFNEM